jgi:hypothetical protein
MGRITAVVKLGWMLSSTINGAERSSGGESIGFVFLDSGITSCRLGRSQLNPSIPVLKDRSINAIVHRSILPQAFIFKIFDR